MAINDGGPAFPWPPVYGTPDMETGDVGNNGMSLRMWLAGLAASGLLASRHPSSSPDALLIARKALEIADALLVVGKEAQP